MISKTALLTFDLEEFVAPKEQGIPCNEIELFRISITGIHTLLYILQKHNVHVTFFTTATFAQNKEVETLLKQLCKEGHEIASHGYDHMDVYEQMNPTRLEKNITAAKRILEKNIGIPILGFRAPRLQKVPFSLLKKIGFFYDASFHPTLVPGHYNNFFGSRRIQRKEVIQIPISVTPLIRVPFSWVWFRNFGLYYVKICTLLNFIDSSFVHLYFHPWDFYNFKQNSIPISWKLASFYSRNTNNAPKMLDAYISWLKQKNVRFMTLKEYIALERENLP